MPFLKSHALIQLGFCLLAISLLPNSHSIAQQKTGSEQKATETQSKSENQDKKSKQNPPTKTENQNSDVKPPKKLVQSKDQENTGDKKENQEPKKELKAKQPLLWKITHKDSPSLEGYLFATTHSRDPAVLKLHPEVVKAIDKSHAMYMELTPDKSGDQHKTLIMADFHRIENRISKELIAELDAALLKIKPELTRKKLPRFRIWAWALILPSLYRQENAPKSKVQDDHLFEIAVQSGKPIQSLELPRQQLVPMNYLSKKEQAALLQSTLKKFNDEKREQEFLEKYLEGEPEELAKFISKEYEPNEFLDKNAQFKVKNYLIDVRNRNIGKKITVHLTGHPKKVHFFSVAASHLVGENSIPQLLKRVGYDITLIRDGIPNVPVENPDAPKSTESNKDGSATSPAKESKGTAKENTQSGGQ